MLHLAIDRTNWQLGKKKVNVLVLGIVLPGKIFIPIVFDLLDKKGNSNQTERSDLLLRFIEIWNSCESRTKAVQEFILVADREFIGSEWFKAIVAAGFNFVIRLRKDDYHHQVAQSMGTNMRHLNDKIRHHIKKDGFFQTIITIKGAKYYYTVFKHRQTQSGDENEFFFVLSTIKETETIIISYDMRWGIECFFKHLKTNGFQLEQLNLKNNDSIALMIAILALVYMMCIKEGNNKKYSQNVKIKYSSDTNKKSFPAQSLFKYGNERLIIAIDSIEKLKAYLLKNTTNINTIQTNIIHKHKKSETEKIKISTLIEPQTKNVQ